MAAVVLPDPHDHRVDVVRRPVLRLVTSPVDGCRSRPSPAVYRRRRLVAIVLATALLVVAAVVVRAGVGALGGSPLAPSEASAVGRLRPVDAGTYVVQPGDTLWSIARSLQPSGDVRPLVDRLAASRHGAVLHPGDRISLG